jgi:hypothetical protein
VRCGNKGPSGSLIHLGLTPTRWHHGDAVMICAATWQIIYSYVLVPKSLPRSYVKFLDRMAGFDSWLVPVARVSPPLILRLSVLLRLDTIAYWHHILSYPLPIVPANPGFLWLLDDTVVVNRR